MLEYFFLFFCIYSESSELTLGTACVSSYDGATYSCIETVDLETQWQHSDCENKETELAMLQSVNLGVDHSLKHVVFTLECVSSSGFPLLKNTWISIQVFIQFLLVLYCFYFVLHFTKMKLNKTFCTDCTSLLIYLLILLLPTQSPLSIPHTHIYTQLNDFEPSGDQTMNEKVTKSSVLDYLMINNQQLKSSFGNMGLHWISSQNISQYQKVQLSERKQDGGVR